MPQELQARRANVQQALAQSERQQERLLSAYLAEVIDLQTFERSRASLQRQQESLTWRQRELAACAQKQIDLRAVDRQRAIAGQRQPYAVDFFNDLHSSAPYRLGTFVYEVYQRDEAR